MTPPWLPSRSGSHRLPRRPGRERVANDPLLRLDVLDAMAATAAAHERPCLVSRPLTDLLATPTATIPPGLAAAVLVAARHHWGVPTGRCRVVAALRETPRVRRRPPRHVTTRRIDSVAASVYLFNDAYVQEVVDDWEGHQVRLPDLVTPEGAVVARILRSVRSPEAAAAGLPFQDLLSLHVVGENTVASR